MTELLTLCHNCDQDFALPDTYASGVAVRCPNCRAVATSGVRYRYCLPCGSYYRPDLVACPTAASHPAEQELPLEYYLELRDIYTQATRAASNGNLPAGSNGNAPVSSNGNGKAHTNGSQNKAGNGNQAAPTLGADGRVRGDNSGRGGVYAYLPSFPLPAAPAPLMVREEATSYEVDDGDVDRDSDDSDFGPAAATVQAVAPAAVADEQAEQPGEAERKWDNAEFELINDPKRMAEVIQLLLKETVIAVDTETTGLDPYTNDLLLLQIATHEHGYIFDMAGGSNGGKKLDVHPLKRVLEHPDILKLLQNAKFDYKMLMQQTGIALNNIYDTMLAERVLTSGISREVSLKNIANKYLGRPIDKTEQKSFIGMTPGSPYSQSQLEYAIRDVHVLFPLWEAQKPQLKKHKLERTVQLEFECVPAVGDMELAGVKIDETKWRHIIEAVKVLRDEAAGELHALLAPATLQATMLGVSSINLNSGQQLIEVFGRLGVALPDTSEGTLTKFDHPAVKKLLEYRTHEKTLSAFGENMLLLIHKKTGRIHPNFNQHGADTGRFSASEPNVQQIPATSEFRECFIPEAGYKLITCDYSQAELRILAQLSEDPAFIEAFVSGGDLHQLTASQMFQVPVEEVTKQQRGQAKAINFGLAYGRGSGSLAVQLGVDVDEAKRLIDTYFKAYSGVQRWLDGAARLGVRKLYSETPIGRKRFFTKPDPASPDFNAQRAAIERQAKNAPIQGANADMTKYALVALRDSLRDYPARIVNTVHDEIIVEAREDVAEIVCQIVEQEMIRAGQKILTLVPVKADAHIGDYWSK